MNLNMEQPSKNRTIFNRAKKINLMPWYHFCKFQIVSENINYLVTNQYENILRQETFVYTLIIHFALNRREKYYKCFITFAAAIVCSGLIVLLLFSKAFVLASSASRWRNIKKFKCTFKRRKIKSGRIQTAHALFCQRFII